MTHRRRVCELSGMAMGMALLVLTGGAPAARSAEFSEAEIFFELNDSAGDLGIHGSIDGGPYVTLEIEDPRERVIYFLRASGRIALQGLTQLAFESAEPAFDELAPARFFARFPEGAYEIEAVERSGAQLEATVRLSHVLAARPGNITAAGVPAVDCEVPALPLLAEPVLIDWDPVTQSHPAIGKAGPVEIVRYQLFVEAAEGVKFGVDLPPSVTEFEIPAEILAMGDEFKFEIIARTSSGNNTAVESCFLLE